ncbi:MAG: hypothetical protein KIT77_07710 [Caldilinea sp.]|nr:hypothetical protein [Caldilinea sp.]
MRSQKPGHAQFAHAGEVDHRAAAPAVAGGVGPPAKVECALVGQLTAEAERRDAAWGGRAFRTDRLRRLRAATGAGSVWLRANGWVSASMMAATLLGGCR